MLLFIVKETFMITGRGLILGPGLGKNFTKVGTKIKLVKPDKSIIETTIRGISFNGDHDILVDSTLTKSDVPIGTEVWLSEGLY
jgi:hypothetical protein